MTNEFTFKTLPGFNQEEKNKANKNIIDRVTIALFFFFKEANKEMTDIEVDELFDDVFGVSSIVLGVLGMDVLGENSDGEYVVRFKPYGSIEEFGRNNGI